MKFLFKVFLLSRPKEQGFVIPVVIALGLIMTLVGTISIFQSSDEQITATSQRASAKALAAAEIGVARYRELIDTYKIIATYPACVSWGSDGKCDDTNNTISWGNISALTDGSGNSIINDSCPNDGSTEVVEALTDDGTTDKGRNWQNIDDADPSKGQYRLWNYTYTSNYDDGPNAGDSSDDVGYTGVQPTGVLVVEGQADGATAKIQVDLPIQPGIPTRTTNDNTSPLIPRNQIELEDDFNNFNPALWITNGTGTSTPVSVSLSGVKVNGNIIVKDTNCSPNSLPNTASLNDTDDSIIVNPQVVSHYESTNLPLGTTLNNIDGSNLPGATLPRDTDSAASDNIYYYNVSGNINFSDGKVLSIPNGTKVVLFINGNITLTSDNTDTPVQEIYLNDDVNNDSSHLEIYGGSGTTSIIFQGAKKIYIKAFIHAPNATVNINDEPDVNITGVMWVKDWTDSSTNTSDTDVTITPDNQYFNYRSVEDLMASGIRLTDPIISQPSQWQVLEAE
ncbi:MAG: hypothetical protein AB4206_16100 [Xenococcaceae cyanobacterium]